MTLKLLSIASGSKGNSTIIMTDNTAILCDAGISISKIKEGLKRVGLHIEDLSGVVVTHEHSDHIYALPKLYDYVPLYAHPLTAQAICVKQGIIKNYHSVDFYEGGFEIGDIKVQPFRIPHDAAYPLGYSFACGKSRVSIATDMGIPTRGVLNNIKDSQVVLLEANHDIEMLKNGDYAPMLKRRILSNNGHLSNDASAIMAENLIGTSIQSIVLGHLSENNNTPDLAYNTVKNKLDAHNSSIQLSLALQCEGSGVFEV